MPSFDIYTEIEKLPPISSAMPASVKNVFHKLAQQILLKLADDLNLPKGSYDLRSHRGGPALL